MNRKAGSPLCSTRSTKICQPPFASYIIAVCPSRITACWPNAMLPISRKTAAAMTVRQKGFMIASPTHLLFESVLPLLDIHEFSFFKENFHCRVDVNHGLFHRDNILRLAQQPLNF